MKLENIAVLLTCYNRKDKTLLCLDAFFKVDKPLHYSFDVFLVDDGSNDGTANEVSNNFPAVKIIQGDGNLFWNKGMRLAWDTASTKDNYKYYIWLNDDSFLFNNAITHLFDCYHEFFNKNNKEVIVVGACAEDHSTLKFSYGLRKQRKELIPNGALQTGNMMNGNFVLVPKKIFKVVGNLSKNFTHAMGDYDYGLRALELGFQITTTKEYIAICESNKNLPDWCNPKKNFFTRWKNFHSPLGLNIKEYKVFRKTFSFVLGYNYHLSIIKVYFRCFFPTITNKIKEL
jgi:GT2 family glycosyltransferase